MEPDLGLAIEWIETNGLGGYASSTAIGVNTRRYHGLLVAALNPPADRYVLLSKLEETLVVNGERYELSANLYPGAIHPQGYNYLKLFHSEPAATFTYEAGGVELEKRVFMVQGENTTVVEYRASGGACELEIRPLIAFRNFHSTTHENSALDPRVAINERSVSVRPYPDLPSLCLSHNGSVLSANGEWYRNFQYPIEAERGLEASEDLFQPLTLLFDMKKAAVINAGLEPRACAVLPPAATAPDQKFIIRRKSGLRSVIAGYHWFADWGRDALIALPGLTLVNARFDVAQEILQAFADATDQGMVPNRFPDAGEVPEYNSIDASLWLFEAVRKYLQYTNDFEFVRETLLDTMKSIIDWHLRGTRYGIRCADDGLLEGGDPTTQLTWMDAKVGDYVATPRYGKAVEIQALWYNALCVIDELCGKYGVHAAAAKASFDTTFWNAETGCFFDCVNAEGKDPSIRPNQLLCFSLGHPIAGKDRAKSVLKVVEQHLLTPFGLRTLSPSDPHYRGIYEGTPFGRDTAYHQGTVWPWLLGPFITAYVRAYPEKRSHAARWLGAFEGMTLIPEIYDGDAPHKPRGCITQAWSVGEIARVWAEDLKAA